MTSKEDTIVDSIFKNWVWLLNSKEDTIVDLIVKNWVWLLKDKCHNSRFYC